ncbi:MAG: tRNA (adenosine(37)-N6)-dimethylallyltransferase MiaA [Bacteroidales bacterium]|nr:tRNA (adenosine(37)-N6)-dimethylallyltransferase MiaA [Bacteroidales bacterium]
MPPADSQKYLVVLLGPTGVGKTDMSIVLARFLQADIVSADSRQFFRELSIGTAPPSSEQLAQVPHHFVGHKSITERYSCGMYELDAMALLDQLYARQRVAMLVGGSGLYIDALCNGVDDFPEPDLALRQQLQQQGLQSLQEQLRTLDPVHYERVDLNNPQRVLKAVEVCLQTGRTFTSFLTAPRKPRPFTVIKVGLNIDRPTLYGRIDRRVDAMMAAGLLDEARSLYPQRGLNALRTVGYNELFQHFDGRIPLEHAVNLIKQNTRRYAKRQLTWWARDASIKWFTPNQHMEVAYYLRTQMSQCQ